MNENQLCQALLSAIAGTPCPITSGTAAIHAAGLVLLWDDRPDTSWPVLDAIASELGEVLTTASIERGPHGRIITGAILRPRERDLDAAAAALRIRYTNATMGSQAPSASSQPGAPNSLHQHAAAARSVPGRVRTPGNRNVRRITAS